MLRHITVAGCGSLPHKYHIFVVTVQQFCFFSESLHQACPGLLQLMKQGGMMSVVLVEQSLRDGLQWEKRLFSLAEKLELVRLLGAAGVRGLELGGLGYPRAVPQLANTDVLADLVRRELPEMRCRARIINEKGLERALQCGLPRLSVSLPATESLSQASSGRSLRHSLELCEQLTRQAVQAGIQVRAGIQSAFGCVYEGRVTEQVVLDLADRLIQAGADELLLADTAGMAGPLQVHSLVSLVRSQLPTAALALHLHDTRGLGLVNIMAGYEAGVQIFDVAAGGLGDCPFFPGTSGNVSTEDAAYLFRELGADSGVDPKAVCQVTLFLQQLLERELPARMGRILRKLREAGAEELF